MAAIGQYAPLITVRRKMREQAAHTPRPLPALTNDEKALAALGHYLYHLGQIKRSGCLQQTPEQNLANGAWLLTTILGAPLGLVCMLDGAFDKGYKARLKHEAFKGGFTSQVQHWDKEQELMKIQRAERKI